MSHTPVLLQEVIEHLSLQKGDIVLDGTVGLGGHARAIGESIGCDGTLIGMDLDSEALEIARAKLEGVPCKVILKEGNYRDFDQALEAEGLHSVNKVLVDLGLSSRQLDISGRGFSYLRNEPLHMTFQAPDTNPDALKAEDILNTWKEEDIANVLYGYGEERFARRIARQVVHIRSDIPISTTNQLVEIIKTATPKGYQHGKTHPATRTFQALRIAVNDELKNLEIFLDRVLDHLSPQGRVAIISFHSLEDRMVKQAFASFRKEGRGTSVTKKPITASREEVTKNMRSRSAKLRIFHQH